MLCSFLLLFLFYLNSQTHKNPLTLTHKTEKTEEDDYNDDDFENESNKPESTRGEFYK